MRGENMSKLIDLTNQTFGYWKVLQRAENSKDGRAKWLCECTACGIQRSVDGSHLRGGRTTNCGCIKMQKMANANSINEIGNKYGKLIVLSKAETPNNKYGCYWRCQCDCGNVAIVKGDYLRNGDTKSCGCLNSKNESIISQLLIQHNINFKTQYYFNDLYSIAKKDKLYFDFAVFNNSQLLYLIEYDGIQHFSKDHEWGNNGFEKTRINDLHKNRYCFNNCIPLIRIPYDCKYSINDLLLETTEFLLTQKNEKEYYDRIKN